MQSKLVVSLFSGAGGLDLGLEQSGLTVSVSQEMDSSAVDTLRANGRKVVAGDIRALLKADPTCSFFECDNPFAVVGGPPCQAFSMAGKRQHVKDPRGTLYRCLLIVGKTLKPRFLVMETVKGVLYIPDLLEVILKDFKKAGYNAVYGVVNAADYGTPQIRMRLIIIGSRDGEIVTIPRTTHENNWATFGDAVRTLKDKGPYVNFSPKVNKLLQHVPPGGNWRDLRANLQSEALGNASPKRGGLCGIMRRLDFNKPSPTLVTSPVQRTTLLAHPTETRPLTVGEYSRVQGFPDTWKFEGSVASQYRQIGNAVPISLGAAIGKTLCDAV